MRVHELKTWPVHYDAIERDEKTTEVRKDDRGFEVGDLLVLREYLPEERHYTGRYQYALVTHIAKAIAGLAPGYVAMSISTLFRPRTRVATWEVA